MDELTRVYSHEHKYKYYNQLYLSFCFYKFPACVWCVSVNLITQTLRNYNNRKIH